MRAKVQTTVGQELKEFAKREKLGELTKEEQAIMRRVESDMGTDFMEALKRGVNKKEMNERFGNKEKVGEMMGRFVERMDENVMKGFQETVNLRPIDQDKDPGKR